MKSCLLNPCLLKSYNIFLKWPLALDNSIPYELANRCGKKAKIEGIKLITPEIKSEILNSFSIKSQIIKGEGEALLFQI